MLRKYSIIPVLVAWCFSLGIEREVLRDIVFYSYVTAKNEVQRNDAAVSRKWDRGSVLWRLPRRTKFSS